MYKPEFSVEGIGNNCYSLNDGEKTVAVVSSQGMIDWLLRFTDIDGEKVNELIKEPHLSYINGFKIELTSKTPATRLKDIEFKVADDKSSITILATSFSADNNFKTVMEAILYVTGSGANYEWHFNTKITSIANKKIEMPSIEYNNLYPHGTGRCMLYEQEKIHSHTLITDKNGDWYSFPHQHSMHYSMKINELGLHGGMVAGFFGEPCPDGCNIIKVLNSSWTTSWAICDMYYDLHCLALAPNNGFMPGETYEVEYVITTMLPYDGNALVRAAKKLPISEGDLELFDYPAIHLGFNSCTQRVKIDSPDDSSCFRPNPPVKVWDKTVGCSKKGSLRITNETAVETVWGIEPPTQIPDESELNITAYIKTDGVIGKGAYVRMNYFTFVWHPEPHCEWAEPMVTEPVNGTRDWVKVTLPKLVVPKEHFDYLINLELVLDGEGIAWFTDFDVDLKYKVKSNKISKSA